MQLHDLRPAPGSKRRRKRVGCGLGSGHGKTACKGHKGQKARTGGGVRPGFEGGQMPLVRRIPKRGFSNAPFKVEYIEVNLDALDSRFEANAEVSPEVLREMGLVKGKGPIKVLGRGELSKPLVVKAHAFSASALDKIVAAGGRAEVISS